MTHKKTILSIKSLLLTGIITLSPALQAFELPAPVKNAKVYAQQRAKFATVMAGAIAKHFWQNGRLEHTRIEEMLGQLYGPGIPATLENIEADAQALYDAIINNPFIDIAPEDFLLGASSSAYQIEGGLDETSAAARFYHDKAELTTAGDAIDFYHHYETDIEQLAQELHINGYRLSLAWNRIQPQLGVFDMDAIQFYKNVIRALIARNIKPMVVFHHYDVPQWFEDLDGFELQENGRYFREFCLKVYTELAVELGYSLISMCNAPEGPAFKGYFTGEGTPGEKNNIQKTHTVIANMYYELVNTALAIQSQYKKLHKENPLLQRPSIGTQINIVLIDPYNNSLKSMLGCAMGSYMQSGGTFDFLVNGVYSMYTPDADFMKTAKGLNVYREHKYAHKAFDWIGVNVYSNRFMDGFEQITGNKLVEVDEERYTDNTNYRNYPEGIYRAVQIISEKVATPLGKKRNKNGKPLPIIITENGIATKDDGKRIRYFQRALWIITQLIKDGYSIVGYLPWTSHDNYEWPTQDNPQGFNSKNYGFFAVNFDKNSPDYMKRTLKDGSCYYADFAQQFFKTA